MPGENQIQCTDCKRVFSDNDYDTGRGDGCHCHSGYNDKLYAEDQINTEEAIACRIFDATDSQSEGLSEEACGKLGRDILLMVLTKFRPDLVSKK